MAKLPEHIATSPMTLACPRCHAIAGKACEAVARGFEVVHVERIAAAAAKDVAAKRKLNTNR
jgi:hypothetical protein